MSLGKTAVAFKSRIVHCPWELEGTRVVINQRENYFVRPPVRAALGQE